jgi:hypothetical protein
VEFENLKRFSITNRPWAKTQPHPRSRPSRLPALPFMQPNGQPIFHTHRPAGTRSTLLVFHVRSPLASPFPRPSQPEVNPTRSNQPSCRSPGVIPRSEIAETKPRYVCPGCFIHTYSNNMINRFHVR